MPKTWFGVIAESEIASSSDKANDGQLVLGKLANVSALSRSIIRYDPKAAATAMSKPLLPSAPLVALSGSATTTTPLIGTGGSVRADTGFDMPNKSESPQRPRTGAKLWLSVCDLRVFDAHSVLCLANKQMNGSQLGSINEDAMSVHSVSLVGVCLTTRFQCIRITEEYM